MSAANITRPPPGAGHNNGPTLEPGDSWRRYAWTRARADLLPTLPIEVLRLRVRRAQDLGLPYKTYASVRASTGRDVIGFLFSSNALDLYRKGQALPKDRQAKLEGLVTCDLTGLAHPPLTAEILLDLAPLDAAFPAPTPHLSWSVMRDHIKGVIRARRNPADGYLIIGETSQEREWAEAAQAAGFLTGSRYFTPHRPDPPP